MRGAKKAMTAPESALVLDGVVVGLDGPSQGLHEPLQNQVRLMITGRALQVAEIFKAGPALNEKDVRVLFFDRKQEAKENQWT